MSWPEEERRRPMNDLAGEVRELVIQVSNLGIRFDNELGAANGSSEGSVKRHLRRIQEDVADMHEIIVGDGKDIGLVARVRKTTDDLREHIAWDKWLFVFIGGGQIIGLIKLFNG